MVVGSYKKLMGLLGRDYTPTAKVWYETGLDVRRAVKQYMAKDEDLRVLDVGCGETCPATMLFTTWGWNTTGIDIEHVWIASPYRAICEAAKGGARSVAKTIARECITVKRSRSALINLVGEKRPKSLDVRHMSVTDLDFADNEFDLIYSHAVLEHVMDMEKGMVEMARVMKPGAISYQVIHLFTSLSGGHDPAWRNSREYIPSDVPPWNHLLNGESPNIDSLNKLRDRDYREYFDRHFEVLEWRRNHEGEHILTDEIRKQLSEYDEEELLTQTIVVVARKPSC